MKLREFVITYNSIPSIKSMIKMIHRYHTSDLYIHTSISRVMTYQITTYLQCFPQDMIYHPAVAERCKFLDCLGSNIIDLYCIDVSQDVLERQLLRLSVVTYKYGI
jgi:hypothetical protein